MEKKEFKGVALYQIICRTTGQRYFGSTINYRHRVCCHRAFFDGRCNKKMRDIIEKYGADSFVFSIIEKWENQTKDSLKEAAIKEMGLIKLYAKIFPEKLLNTRIHPLQVNPALR